MESIDEHQFKAVCKGGQLYYHQVFKAISKHKFCLKGWSNALRLHPRLSLQLSAGNSKRRKSLPDGRYMVFSRLSAMVIPSRRGRCCCANVLSQRTVRLCLGPDAESTTARARDMLSSLRQRDPRVFLRLQGQEQSYRPRAIYRTTILRAMSSPHNKAYLSMLRPE
jgi:hypothetical protein